MREIRLGGVDARLGQLKGRWVVSWWTDGKRTRHRLDGPTERDAERQAIDLIRSILVQHSDHTIAGLWEAYRVEKEGRRVAVAMKHETRTLMAHFGHLRPDQLTIRHSRDYTAARRAAGKHDGTIWTELGHLRTVLKWAKDNRMIDHAPAIDRPAKPPPREGWLNAKEIRQLLDAPMAEHIRLAILLMLSTACRIAAALELTWDRVDFERGQIDLRLDAQGPRKGRAVVPMNAGLRAALLRAREAALTDHVIEWNGGPVQSIKTGFRAAVKNAGLRNITPHDLRRTAAIHLVAGGMKMERVAQYLGHTNTSVTYKVYGRYQPDHLQEEADLLDFTKPRSVSG